MSGISGAINTALSGLELFEAGISTVSNNLANQSTTGYSVEGVNALAAVSAAGQPGDGVQPAQITRAASGFAAAVLRAANSAAQAAANQSTSLTSISNALTNNGDVQTSLNQFFQDISTLAASPSSAAQRQTVLADAQNIVSSFQNAAGTVQSSINGNSQTLSQNVSAANNLLGQLASINTSLGLSPNTPSLLDQQQAVLNSLSGLISINALSQPNGTVIVTTGGTVLLDQSGAQSLNIAANASGAASLTAGNDDTPVTATESDGSIGSAIASWRAGSTALQGLSGLASVFATTINNVQAQGLTPSGMPGTAIFSVPASTVSPNAANTGTAAISARISNPSALPITGGPFSLTYGSAGWTATDQNSGQSLTATGTPPVVAGITLNITGTPNIGDQFTLNPAPDAATGIAVIATSPNDIAAADPYVATPGTLQSDGSTLNSNGGTITAGTDTVTATPNANAALIPASYFGQNLQITFNSPTAYTVTTSADPTTPIATGTLGATGGNIAVAYPAGGASGQYWQLPISGSPAKGDTLTLTAGGTSSGSNAARLAAAWTASGTTTSGTLQSALVGFGTALGANAQQAQQLSTAAGTQVTTATSNLQTISGVNTDEQAVTLTNYQQAYQAAAQAISGAHTMFESLLSAI
jgi:flagellar hook-associated protein 1 FlgK